MRYTDCPFAVQVAINATNGYDIDASVERFRADLIEANENRVNGAKNLRTKVEEVFADLGNPKTLLSGIIENKLHEKLGSGDDQAKWKTNQALMDQHLASFMIGSVSGSRVEAYPGEAAEVAAKRLATRAANKAAKAAK